MVRLPHRTATRHTRADRVHIVGAIALACGLVPVRPFDENEASHLERNVPYRYRNARRMEAAYSLLRETTMPLRTIAEALGFVDVFHLSHA